MGMLHSHSAGKRSERRIFFCRKWNALSHGRGTEVTASSSCTKLPAQPERHRKPKKETSPYTEPVLWLPEETKPMVNQDGS